ncbi:MAG: ABC transporter substrate-binding protein [Deltaproteobacteria bacterium]|nr:ABC transporter substrate-binding protein [Deltaproteobacteria bacterium]
MACKIAARRRDKRRCFSNVFIASLWVLSLLSLPRATWSAGEKFIFGWSAIAGAQAIPWVAKEAGLFEKHGLEATLIYLDGGSKATQALMSGDIPIAQIGGAAPIAARLRGGDVAIIAGIVNVLAYSLIVSPEIKRPEDLRGKKLAVSRFGSNSDYATRKILVKWGLRPDRDVAIMQIPGGQPTRLAALQNGQVAGLVAQPPVINLARKFRLPILAEPEDFGSAYPNTPIAAGGLFLREKRDTARKFIKALAEGIYVYKTKSDFSKKVIAKYMRVADPEAIDDSYQFFARLVPAKPYPPLDGIREALLEAAERDPKARTARPEEFADMNLVREIDESGFIDALYKGKK